MEYQLSGEVAQVATLTLTAGETVWAAKGSIISFAEQGIDWRMKVPGGAGAAVGRMVAGEGAVLTFIEAREDTNVTLGSNQPGKIAVWDLQTDGPLIATRGAFLAACGDDIQITPTVAKRAGAAMFGGAGLIMQRVEGRGLAFVYGSGDFIEYNLVPGQSVQVSSGNLAAYSAHCDYQIKTVGGCLKMIFGGEGLFMTRLTGTGHPGGPKEKVLIQTLKRTYARSQRMS